MTESTARSRGEDLDALRPLLFSIAYRMLSSVAEAEDVVQEAFLRYQAALDRGTVVESRKAYLSAVVTRLAIDELRSAQRQRESYVGEWLPEPLLASEDDPAGATEEKDSVSMAFLLVLERLSPVERAVFLLHDVFNYEYAEVAAIVQKSEVNCRQLLSRARRHVRSDRPRFDVSIERREELATRFFAALRSGEVEALASTLAADVVVHGDGGGKAPQWTRPIVGAEPVSRLLAGMSRQFAVLDVEIEQCRINGQPGAVFRDRNGLVISIFALDVVDDAIRTIRGVINPDKLRHIGPVADARSLAKEAAEALHGRSPPAGAPGPSTGTPSPKR